MRILILAMLPFLLNQCLAKSQSYKACENADVENLLCSLVIYQQYNTCSVLADAISGTTEKAQAKFQCDANRLNGLFICNQRKEDTCGK